MPPSLKAQGRTKVVHKMYSKVLLLLLLNIEAASLRPRNNWINTPQHVPFDTSLSGIEHVSDSDGPEYVSMSEPDFSDSDLPSSIQQNSSTNFLSLDSLNLSSSDDTQFLSDIEENESASARYISMPSDFNLNSTAEQSGATDNSRNLFTLTDSTFERLRDSDDIYPNDISMNSPDFSDESFNLKSSDTIDNTSLDTEDAAEFRQILDNLAGRENQK